MKWTNKIMQINQDPNTSRLSSRSLSKFKKVNLQKSQAQISSNDHLEKSQLKLNSVQKIKQFNNVNRSCIANYIGLNLNKNENSNHPLTSPITTNNSNVKTGFHFESLTQRNDKNIYVPLSQFYNESQYRQGIQQSQKQLKYQFQGLSLFHKDTILSTKDNNLQHHSTEVTAQHNRPQVQLQHIISQIHELLESFNKVSLLIKSSLKQTALLVYEKLHVEMSSFIQTFQRNLQNGIKQLIELKNNQISNFDMERILKNDFHLSQKDQDSQAFYKIKYFEHEQVYHQEKQKQDAKNRPYSFKNKFKQIIVDSDHNIFTMAQMPTKALQQSTNKPQEKQAKKLTRKRTNPIPRVNSLFDNESTINNENSLRQEHNISANSIKYCKMNDRSASRSVKKLQQKIAVIKNIFKSGTTKQQEKSQTLHQVTSKC